MSTPPPPTPPPPEPPVRIGGRYRLLERIGQGAMGAVWLATDELLNRAVAVKELLAAAVPPGPEHDEALEESRQRILREGRIGARLQHPHVISVFDVVVHDDRPWLVMEYLPSTSLAGLIQEKGPLDPRRVAEIGRQVADGLAAAHVAGVVHRDVKPGNVLIAEDGRVKITDFGVSRAVDDVQLTRTGLIAGTPAFLSPEVARGAGPSAASDVFALGATLYAAVEGLPPFGLDDNAYALLHKVATGAVTPPQRSGMLTAVLMRLLAVEPGERPTAAQARDALGAVAAGGSGTAVLGGTGTATALLPDPGPPARAAAPPQRPLPPQAAPGAAPPRPPRRRGRGYALLAGAAVLLLAVIAAVLLTRGGGGQEPVPPAAEPTVTESAEPTTEPPETTVEETTTEPEPTAEPTPAGDAAAFVEGYYGLLPGDTDAAWELLGEQARAQSGGKGGYDAFWAGMEAVSLEDVSAEGDGVVVATVVFTPAEGQPSAEPYRFVVAEGGTGTVIESFQQL